MKKFLFSKEKGQKDESFMVFWAVMTPNTLWYHTRAPLVLGYVLENKKTGFFL
jgi:hypothetical protein